MKVTVDEKLMGIDFDRRFPFKIELVQKSDRVSLSPLQRFETLPLGITIDIEEGEYLIFTGSKGSIRNNRKYSMFFGICSKTNKFISIDPEKVNFKIPDKREVQILAAKNPRFKIIAHIFELRKRRLDQEKLVDGRAG